ncbi:MAG TPA: lipopolysaccharide heptosyltransferase II [Burkholderiales bacterium]|jgi:heptosyltransferase-2|nr:lipopolysaccharide heptosyltransferase II [Burkholderiales bacterium]
MKVLVVGPSWIGDTVLAQPLLALLHQQHADLELDVLAPAWSFPVVRRMPEVRRAIANPFQHGELKLLERRRLGVQLRAEHYDQAIVLPNTLKSAFVPVFARIPRRTGYSGEMRWGTLNDVRLLDPLALPQMAQRYAALALGPHDALPAKLPEPHLTVEDAQRRATLDALGLGGSKRAVAMCPGAEYGPAKRWPPSYFAELARALAAGGDSIWLIGSAKDAPIAEDIVRLSEGVCLNLCGKTSLDQAIDLLASARLAITNDSGLMHVAAAVGTPLVAIYGSSTPEHTPPMSPRAVIAKLDMPCSPCFERTCPLGHFNCMMMLKPERVAALAARSDEKG